MTATGVGSAKVGFLIELRWIALAVRHDPDIETLSMRRG
jgi:hypothetical protein